MDYFCCIFIRDLSRDDVYNIIETLQRFSGGIIHAEKDILVGRCTDIRILSCLMGLKETHTEARFGFSQYVGLAKGLAKIAKFGEILISEEIEQKVIETYELTSLGMLSIEGMSSQILVCRIERSIGELQYPAQQTEEFTITRKNEIESLHNLLRVANAVVVLGPVGSGKTTFLNQTVADWEGKLIHRTFCPPYTLVQAFKPITDITRQTLGICGITGIEEQQRTIEKKLQELEMADIATSYLAILDFLELGEEESILEKLDLRTRIDIIASTLAEVFKRQSWVQPLVIVIEDIENMDSSSVNLLQKLKDMLSEHPVCFIFTSSIPQITITGLKEFELRNIKKRSLEEMVEQVTDEKISLPPTTPFHVLQYLRLYQEEKFLYLYRQYQGETTVTSFNLPFHDIKTIIKRRIDLIDDDKKEFLFSLAAAGVYIDPDDMPIDKKNYYLFDFCIDRGFITKHYDTYIFTSTLLRDEIYNLIPDKKSRHAHLADYYRRMQGFEEKAAFHYIKAENQKKAIDFLMKSASRALQKGGYESAIHFYNQALDICQHQKEAANLEVLVALNEGMADIYRSLGDEDKALKYYKVVLDSYKEILKE